MKNEVAENVERFTNELNSQGKDDRDMTTRSFAVETAPSNAPQNHKRQTRANLISRRRWLRMVAMLAGIMMLVLQTAPALASRAMLEDNPNSTGIGRSSYEATVDPISFASASLTGQQGQDNGSFSSGNGIAALQDAVDRLRETQMSSDSAIADLAGNPGGSPDSDANLAQADTPPLVVTDEFTDGGNSSLWTGEINGSQALVSEEDGGWYVMIPQAGSTLPVVATGEMNIIDGQIVTDARFYGEGAGEVGIIGRSTIDGSTYYFCSTDVYGGAGCYLFEGSQWYELFRLAPGEVERYQMDRLALDIYGNTLTFFVNGQVIGTYSDAAITGGSWGLATACYEGYCTGNFDFVNVYDYGTSAGNEVPTTTVIATDFNGEQAESFFTGEGDWGYADINDGWYTVALAPGLYFPNMIAGTDGVNDGTITADAAFDGEGAFGIIARLSSNDDGTDNYYVCWVNNYAFANCNVVVNDAWYEIEGSAGVEVTLEDVNRLSMGVMGDDIIFAVNGQLVTDALDSTLQYGAMGFYHEAFGDVTTGFASFIDVVNIEAIGGDSGNFQTVAASDLNENDLGLYTGSGDWGFADFAYDGYYTTELNPGWTFANPIAGTDSVQSGLISTVVEFGGNGSAGLIARHQSSDAGSSYYVCLIDAETALAGCHLVLNGDWYTLAMTENPLALNPSNELVMAVNGSDIYLMVNGEIIIETFDDTLATGDWGLYSDSTSEGEGFWSDTDSISIEQYAGA